MSLFVSILGICGSMDPSAVVPFCRVVDVAIVIQLAYLVSEVYQRNATSAHCYAVCEQNPLQCPLLAGLEASKGSSRARYPAISSPRIILKGNAASEATGMPIDEE